MFNFLKNPRQRGIAIGIVLAIFGFIVLWLWRKKIWGVPCDCGNGYLGDDDCGCAGTTSGAATKLVSTGSTLAATPAAVIAPTAAAIIAAPVNNVTVKDTGSIRAVDTTKEQGGISIAPPRINPTTIKFSVTGTKKGVGATAIKKAINRFATALNPVLDSPASIDRMLATGANQVIYRRFQEITMKPDGAPITAAGKIQPVAINDTYDIPTAQIVYVLLGVREATATQVETAANKFIASVAPLRANQSLSTGTNIQ